MAGGEGEGEGEGEVAGATLADAAGAELLATAVLALGPDVAGGALAAELSGAWADPTLVGVAGRSFLVLVSQPSMASPTAAAAATAKAAFNTVRRGTSTGPP